MSSSPEYVVDQRWPLSAVTVSQMRDSVRAVVPEFAAAVTAAVMQSIPETVLSQVTSKVTAALQNKLVSKTFTAPVSMLPKQSETTGSGGEAQACHAKNEPVIKLWPAEVAAYLGKDSRMSRDEALAAVWRRTHETSMHKVHKEWVGRGMTPKRVTQADVEACVVGEGRDGGGPVTPHVSRPAKFSHILTKEDMRQFCADQGTSKASIQSMYLEKGRTSEDETAALLSKVMKQDLALRNSASYWRPGVGAVAMDRAHEVRRPGPITDPGPYAFMGEVDGWLTEEPYKDVIVEIKTRMNGIPDAIPIKDILQVQTYMMMHDKERALHVQRAFATSVVVVNEIKRNKELWASTVEPAIVQFVCDVRKLLRGSVEDELIRHRVLSAVERSSPPLMAPLPPPVPKRARTPEPAPLEIPSVSPSQKLKRKHVVLAAAGPPPLPPFLQELPSLDAVGHGENDEEDDDDHEATPRRKPRNRRSQKQRPAAKKHARDDTEDGDSSGETECECDTDEEDEEEEDEDDEGEEYSSSVVTRSASARGSSDRSTRSKSTRTSSTKTPPAHPPVSTVFLHGHRPATRLSAAAAKIKTRKSTPGAVLGRGGVGGGRGQQPQRQQQQTAGARRQKGGAK